GRCQPSNHAQSAITTSLLGKIGRANSQRRPHLEVAREAESRRQHANHRERHTVHVDAAADYVRIATELTLPQPVREDENALAARLVSFISDPAPQLGRDAEQRKEIRRTASDAQVLGRAVSGYVPAAETPGRERLEAGCLRLQIAQLDRRQRALRELTP